MFTSRRRDRSKRLSSERNGLWLLSTRRERGSFPRFLLEGTKALIEIDRSWLAMTLDGIEPASANVHSHRVRRVARRSARRMDSRTAPRFAWHRMTGLLPNPAQATPLEPPDSPPLTGGLTATCVQDGATWKIATLRDSADVVTRRDALFNDFAWVMGKWDD